MKNAASFVKQQRMNIREYPAVAGQDAKAYSGSSTLVIFCDGRVSDLVACCGYADRMRYIDMNGSLSAFSFNPKRDGLDLPPLLDDKIQAHYR